METDRAFQDRIVTNAARQDKVLEATARQNVQDAYAAGRGLSAAPAPTADDPALRAPVVDRVFGGLRTTVPRL
jgi:hypothetical protein